MTSDEARIFLHDQGVIDDGRSVHVGGFGDSAALSAELIGLIRAGEKTATTSAVAAFTATAEEIPKVGDWELVLHLGKPEILIVYRALEIREFHRVTAEFAAKEGEGDRSLGDWRAAHERYFARESAELGYAFHPAMLVLCAEFELVFDFDV